MAVERPVFLTARWQSLLMLNYEADPALLQPHIPSGTELDDYAGRIYVSLVGFRFLHTRVMGLPIPFHRHFDEVNLRFYVRRDEAGGVQRGVVFIKEIVPRRAFAIVARRVYNENYVAMPMRHEVRLPGGQAPGGGHVRYAWRSGCGWNHVSAKITGEPVLPAEASEASFITEHYWGYSRQRDGSTLAYRVEHPRWRVWRADDAELACDVAEVYGNAWMDCLRQTPASAFVAEGSDVWVRRGLAAPG